MTKYLGGGGYTPLMQTQALPSFAGAGMDGMGGGYSPLSWGTNTGMAPSVEAPSSMFGGFLSDYNKQGQMTSQGWGLPAISVANGLFNAWMGMKQYGLAKEGLKESKRQFGLNWEAQKKTVNGQLEDRQRARVASNPGAYQSVGDYMKQNAITGG